MRRSSSRHLAISSSRHLAISPSRLTAFASGLALGPRALVRKELRTRSRGWRPMWLLTIYLLVLAVAVAGFLALVERTSPTVPPQIGSMLFAALSVASVLMLALIAPSLTVGAISGERERRTLELLLVTRASPLGLVSGKLLASLIYTLYLLAASLPPFAVVYLFGGVPPEYVAAVIGIATVTALTNAALGLLFSALLRRTALASVVTHSLVVLLVFGLPVLWLYAGQGAQLWVSLPPTDETVPAPLPPLVPFYISPLLSLLSLLRGLLFTSGALGPAFFPSSTLPITQAVYVLSPFDGSRGSLATVLSWAPWVFQLAFGGVLTALCLACSALAIAPLKPWRRPPARPAREEGASTDV